MKKKILVQCNSDQGSFYYEPVVEEGTTAQQIQKQIDDNGGKVTGYRYTNVKVFNIQKGIESINRI